ncbi:Quino protein alcohol dehydrogenase-like protein [Rhizodiscina lignyota]|uniref:Quino protein alcohol dehydrogenase-like protein n=1 Tax=Rhizodiscina lignyota TaxID=1504668 RepID=A0A9P4IJ45_9PEZI|nr:Quino protein alcohol dehydrogenase-like protein [Rhizodiscina lignyota]
MLQIFALFAVFLAPVLSDSSHFPGSSHFSPSHGNSLWNGWGGGILNNRWASSNTQVNSASIKSLSANCKHVYDSGVSATPTVGEDGIVYYPTWEGRLVALDYTTCKVKWEINVTEIILNFGPQLSTNTFVPAVARTSPQISNGVLYFGTLLNCLMVAVKLEDGSVLDTFQLNSNQYAIVTMSPTLYNGHLFIGASSMEETAADRIPNYKCCTFTGNVMALTFDGSKFHAAWNISMIPDDEVAMGWTGNAIWGSQPAIDVKRNQVFFATGNVYSVPDVITKCQQQTANITAISTGLVPESCLPSDVWQEAVLAIDIDDGLVNWVRQLSPLDSWTVACGIPGRLPKIPEVCTGVPGPDADFGMAPAYVPGNANTPFGRDIVVVGQKNGNLHALNAQTGSLFWSVATSPDGTGGGLSWGVAADDTRAYFTAINANLKPYHLIPSNQSVHTSAFGAASLTDGRIEWETVVPFGQAAYVPPTVVGDIVIAGRTGLDQGHGVLANTTGGLIVMNKATGEILQDMELDANFHGGIAVQGDYLMFGTGYSGLNTTGTFVVAKIGK